MNEQAAATVETTETSTVETVTQSEAKPTKSKKPVVKKAKAEKKPTKPAKEKKAEPKAKSAPKSKSAASSGGITGTQHKVLKALTKKPLTRKQIAEKAFGGNSINFVPILTPMIEAKLVRLVDVEVDGKGETLVELMAAGKKAAEKAPPVTARGGANHASLPKPGSYIEREYNGKDYRVQVMADGTFKMGKDIYSSLTAVAKAIRGSEMEVNGWAFFKLTKKA